MDLRCLATHIYHICTICTKSNTRTTNTPIGQATLIVFYYTYIIYEWIAKGDTQHITHADAINVYLIIIYYWILTAQLYFVMNRWTKLASNARLIIQNSKSNEACQLHNHDSPILFALTLSSLFVAFIVCVFCHKRNTYTHWKRHRLNRTDKYLFVRSNCFRSICRHTDTHTHTQSHMYIVQQPNYISHVHTMEKYIFSFPQIFFFFCLFLFICVRRRCSVFVACCCRQLECKNSLCAFRHWKSWIHL